MKRRFIRRFFAALLICACIYIPVLMLRVSMRQKTKFWQGTQYYNMQDNTTEETTEPPSAMPAQTNYTVPLHCRKDLFFNLLHNRTILPQNLWENITPREYKMCGINSLISPTFNKNSECYWMIFLVKSAPNHFVLRETIRRTWASVAEMSGRKIRTIFLLGTPTGGSTYQQDLLQEESDLYGDILQCDVEDSYYHLTVKVLSTFRWILQKNVASKYYTFCDDDTTMNMATIFVYFNEIKLRNISDTTICGFKHHTNGEAVRDLGSKWYMSKAVYDTVKYPTFCHGAMWTITPNVLNDLYCMARVTKSENFYLDDVYVTGVLRHKISQSESLIHPPILFNNTPAQLMFYPWGEGRSRYFRLQQKWNTWKILLTSSEPLLKGSDVRVHPQSVKYRTMLPTLSKPIKKKWDNDPTGEISPWAVCVIILVAFICPYGLFIILFVYVSKNSSSTLTNKKVLYEELGGNRSDQYLRGVESLVPRLA